MLQPKRTKFRKQFKGRIHGVAKGGTNLDFGGFGLKALEPMLQDAAAAAEMIVKKGPAAAMQRFNRRPEEEDT